MKALYGPQRNNLPPAALQWGLRAMAWAGPEKVWKNESSLAFFENAQEDLN